jgi:hypothetical protein
MFLCMTLNNSSLFWSCSNWSSKNERKKGDTLEIEVLLLFLCIWPSRRRSFIRTGTRRISGGDSISRWVPHKSASLDKHGVNLLLVCTSVSLYRLIHNFRARMTTIPIADSFFQWYSMACLLLVSGKKIHIIYFYMVTSPWHCAKTMVNAYHLSSVFYTTLS